VLRRDEDALDLDRPLPLVLVDLVPNRDLCLAVGTQIRKLARLSHLREAAADVVRQHDRKGHQFLRLVRRVAEHHSLVARAHLVQWVVVTRVVLCLVRRVDALRDVRRLLVDRDHDTAGRGVEAPLRMRVADVADALADELRDVDVRLGRDLAGHDHEAGRDERLARDPAGRIVAQHAVEHGVRDLVRDLVRMALGDGLGREAEGTGGHCGREGYLTPTNPVSSACCPLTLP
jgi:YD repeat-containing protein